MDGREARIPRARPGARKRDAVVPDSNTARAHVGAKPHPFECRAWRTSCFPPGMLGTLRQARPGLRRAPGSALTTVLTVALGVGAATAMFAVLNGVVLRPLPYPGADRLLRVWSGNPARDLPFFSVSAPDAIDWAAQATSLAAVGAFERPESLAWTDAGPAEELLVRRAAPGVVDGPRHH